MPLSRLSLRGKLVKGNEQSSRPRAAARYNTPHTPNPSSEGASLPIHHLSNSILAYGEKLKSDIAEGIPLGECPKQKQFNRRTYIMAKAFG